MERRGCVNKACQPLCSRQEVTSNYDNSTNSSGDGSMMGGTQKLLPLRVPQSSAEKGPCEALEDQLSHLGKGTTWLSICLGQLCSGLLCLSAITCVFLADVHSIRLPNAQNFAFYLLLSLVFTSLLACRRGERNLFPVLRLRGWKYLLITLTNVQGNFLTLKAYQFTSLTSIQLLDCFSIPTLLSLSWLILRVRYGVPHILGVLVCLLGVSCLVWADVESEGRHIGTGKDRFIGDMMSLGGAFLYGLSGVAEEFVVRTFDWIEFLGMTGLFGSFICGLQTILLESSTLLELTWSWGVVAWIAAYAASQFLFCFIGALVIKLSSVTALNLSTLSADFYALLVGIQLFQYKFHALYFLSFVLVMSGVILFSAKPTGVAVHLYRSLLVREQTTITTDLELIAAGAPFSPHALHDVESPLPDTNYAQCSSFADVDEHHDHHHDYSPDSNHCRHHNHPISLFFK